MAVPRLDRGAHRKGAPFAFLLGLLLSVGLLSPPALPACELDRADTSAAVAYIYDGDTLKLDDGRKVRFIGINTPEINHDGGPSEPFARAARQRLQALVGDGRVLLRFDRERRDRYGRLLAHPYLADGRSLSRILLAEGLAAAVVIPPNLWHSDCYLQTEREARAAARGLWSPTGEVLKTATELVRGDEGFALLQGRVEEVAQSRRSVWLELEGNVALRLPRSSLQAFDRYDPLALSGEDVEARGWLTYYKGKWRMTVRHPAALTIRSMR